jgi:hypothetical protein
MFRWWPLENVACERMRSCWPHDKCQWLIQCSDRSLAVRKFYENALAALANAATGFFDQGEKQLLPLFPVKIRAEKISL